jgi:hypothetical protein
MPIAEIIAKISAILVDDPVRLGFAALVVRRGFVKLTIETDVHI